MRTAAIAAVLLGATALSGCTGLAGRTLGDSTVTGSIGTTNAAGTLNQPMPSSLGAPMQVADSRFLPPANVGGGMPASNPGGFTSSATAMVPMGQTAGSVSTQDLPTLSSSPSGTHPAMPAQQTLAPITPARSSSQLPVNSNVPTSAPNLTVVQSNPQGNVYTHTIQSGESLYTIARRYNVTTQAIVQANGMSSPDKIHVGQSVIIPGRPDLLAKIDAAPTQVASAGPAGSAGQVGTSGQTATALQAPAGLQTRPTGTQLPVGNSPLKADAQAQVQPQQRLSRQQGATDQPKVASLEPQRQAPQAQVQAQAPQVQAQPQTQAQPQQTPLEEPAVSSDKFRWPVSGRVITDFSSSKGTGINIEVQEGTAVKAAENGTVIYVGNGVEGYGNMVLIRHANGYVSAYAHLKDTRVNKGATVNRGEVIGGAGMTGSVNRPQLHFELRKGATPVDPVPLLAS